jgi:adenine-specific DNA-methyltransferase
MDIKEIKVIMEKYGNYGVMKQKYRRFKSDKTKNRSYKSEHTYEFLHILEKKG